MFNKIPFQKKKLYINLIVIFIIIFGFINIFSTKKQRYPDVVQYAYTVFITYPGAQTDEVYNEVVLPLERSIRSISGVESYKSVIFQESAKIDIFFYNTVSNLGEIKAKTHANLSSTKLPDKVLQPIYWEWIVSEEPIIDLVLYSETLEYEELKKGVDILEDLLVQTIEIQGINHMGYFDTSFSVEFKKEKIKNIPFFAIIEQLQLANLSLNSQIFNIDSNQTSIIFGNKKATIEQIEQIIINTPLGAMELKDIAEVTKTFENRDTLYRVNGYPAVSVLVRKKDEIDLFKAMDVIKNKTEKFLLDYPEINLKMMNDTSLETSVRLKSIFNNVLMGIFLVICILFIFIHFQAALWVVYSMILSILLSFPIFQLFNITLNASSLVAIVIVSGMLIDNAIVIVEGVYRHKSSKSLVSWKEASIITLKNYALPILSSVVTTMVAFYPLYQLKGDMGQWAKQIPLVIIIVLIASLFQSLFILIAQLYLQSDERQVKYKERRFMVPILRFYERSLSVILNRAKTWIGVSFVILILSIIILAQKPFVAYSDQGVFRFTINGEVEDSLSVDETLEKVYFIENHLLKYPKDLMTSFSIEIGGLKGVQHFVTQVELVYVQNREITANEVIEDILEKINTQEAISKVNIIKDLGGLPEKDDIIIKIFSESQQERKEILQEVTTFLEEQHSDRLKNLIFDGFQERRVLKFQEKRGVFSTLGVNPYELLIEINALMGTVIIDHFEEKNKNYYMRVSFNEKVKTIEELEELEILLKNGRRISIKELGEFTESFEPQTIYTENNQKMAQIFINLNEIKDLPIVLKSIQNELGYLIDQNGSTRIALDGKIKENREMIEEISYSALISVIGIFGVLIFTFGSFIKPLVILMAIPYSLFGVAFVLLIHQMPISYMALFGVIGLGGVVVNNSIILTSVISDRLKEIKSYKNIKSIIIQSSLLRFRPILITTVTTIIGLIPSAYNLGGEDYFIVPTVRVMSFGLLFSMLFILFIIPCFYYIYYERKRKKDCF